MLYKVDFNVSVWRWLFQPLYSRIEQACIASGDPLDTHKTILTALLNNDPKYILLVDTLEHDPSKIQGHCLINLIPLADNKVQVFYTQLFTDSGHNTSFAHQCIDYSKVIAKEYPVKELAMLTNENKYRAFKKKYEFQVRKVYMVREYKEEPQLELGLAY
jgi:hypothetical protein